MKKTILTTLIIATGAFATLVFAQAPCAPGGTMRDQIRQRIQERFAGAPRGPGGMAGAERGDILKHVIANPELARKAGVTDEQIAKIKQGQIEFEKKMITARAEAETAKLDVRSIMESEKVDRAALEKAIDAAAAKELALRKAGIMRMLDVKEALGKETIEKIKAMTREHMAQGMKAQGGAGRAPMMQPRGQGQFPQGAGPRPWQQAPVNAPPPPPNT